MTSNWINSWFNSPVIECAIGKDSLVQEGLCLLGSSMTMNEESSTTVHVIGRMTTTKRHRKRCHWAEIRQTFVPSSIWFVCILYHHCSFILILSYSHSTVNRIDNNNNYNNIFFYRSFLSYRRIASGFGRTSLHHFNDYTEVVS